MITVAHIFYDVYMGYSHKGLRELIRASMKKEEPEENEVVVFINSSWTAAKLVVAGNIFLYHRSQSGPVTIESIRKLPLAFGGKELRFSKELASALLKRLGKTTKAA